MTGDLFGYEKPKSEAKEGRLSACRACGKGELRCTPVLFAGLPIWEWICCDDCPHKAELNPKPTQA